MLGKLVAMKAMTRGRQPKVIVDGGMANEHTVWPFES